MKYFLDFFLSLLLYPVLHAGEGEDQLHPTQDFKTGTSTLQKNPQTYWPLNSACVAVPCLDYLIHHL